MTAPLIGCIADDHTGGTDIAAALRRNGLRTVLLFGSPDIGTELAPCDAVVVALKSRALPVREAISATLAAHAWLTRDIGVGTIYLKYCSTFDSTDDGNIGPVCDAVTEADGQRVVVHCPSAPDHGRTMYQGHLFVGDRLLSASSMRRHPLTPMTDSNIVAVLGRQTPYAVGLIPSAVVRTGSAAIRTAIAGIADRDVRHVLIDATDNSDLATIAAAVLPARGVLAGSAGLAGALGRVLHDSMPPTTDTNAAAPATSGPVLVLAGSCSDVTLGQVALARTRFRHHRLDPRAGDVDELYTTALQWLTDNLRSEPIMIYSSAPAEERGPFDPALADHLETAMGELARAAVALGAATIVVAGGETSGAVVTALNIGSVTVESELDPGVPWCRTTFDDRPLALVLKSGNFGRPDLLLRAATTESSQR